MLERRQRHDRQHRLDVWARRLGPRHPGQLLRVQGRRREPDARARAPSGRASGVRVNALAPGFFASEMTGGAVTEEQSVQYLRRNTPMGRAGDAHELDGVAAVPRQRREHLRDRPDDRRRRRLDRPMTLDGIVALVAGGASRPRPCHRRCAGAGRRGGRRARPPAVGRSASAPRAACVRGRRRHATGAGRGGGRRRPPSLGAAARRASTARASARRAGRGKRRPLDARPVPDGHRHQPDRHVQRHPAGRGGDAAASSRSTASAASSSTPPRSPRSTGRSARRPTRRRRAASSA